MHSHLEVFSLEGFMDLIGHIAAILVMCSGTKSFGLGLACYLFSPKLQSKHCSIVQNQSALRQQKRLHNGLVMLAPNIPWKAQSQEVNKCGVLPNMAGKS